MGGVRTEPRAAPLCSRLLPRVRCPGGRSRPHTDDFHNGLRISRRSGMADGMTKAVHGQAVGAVPMDLTREEGGRPAIGLRPEGPKPRCRLKAEGGAVTMGRSVTAQS